ncbi:MAG: hypothetical protein Q7S23_00145 [bacterium]|nr:hypothetical protein [bacterium]
MVANFRWFIANQLAGGSKPCYEEDVLWLALSRFRAVVSLEDTSDFVDRLLAERRFARHRLLIEFDQTDQELLEPTADEIATALAFVRDHLTGGHPVYVHCSAGIRRTRYFIDRVLPVLALTRHDP